jgi:hypothetical protein
MQKHSHKKKNKQQQNMPRVREALFFRYQAEDDTNKIVRRRCTLVNSLTGVTGNPMSYSINSSSASSAFEFSNYALIYLEYRVRAIRVRVIPRFRDNIQSVASVPYPGSIASGGYIAGAGSSTPAAIFAQANGKISPEWAAAENMVTWDLNTNAKLWTPTSTTISTANQFGCQFLSTANCPAFYNTVTTADTFVEFDIEFRSKQ